MRQVSRAAAVAAWLCAVALSASAQTTPGHPSYPAITSSPLSVDASYEPGSIGPLYNMTNYFLKVVQPNAWPTDIIGADFVNITQNVQKLASEVALYEAGFIVCALIGILFIVLMPIVGYFFCVCRCCCDNCGGEMHQREKDNTPCRRHAFATFLALVTIGMLAGIGCAFATNEQATRSTSGLPQLVMDNLNDVSNFISDIPKQGNSILDEYNTLVTGIKQQLNSINSSVGGPIQHDLYVQANPLQLTALALYAKMGNISDTLKIVDAIQRRLAMGVEALSANLTAERTTLTLALGSCAPGCNATSAKLSNLTVNGGFENMANLSEQIATVNSSMMTNIPQLVQQGNRSIADIPDRVANQTRTSVENAETQLNNINVTISSIRTDIFDKFLQSGFKSTISSLNATIAPILPNIPVYEHYVWIAGVVLCCMILLICVANILGLLFGACGYDRNEGPTERGCTSNCGGYFLMASAGLSFIFSWLLMILVTILFIVFGNAHKLVCEPLASKDLLTYVDTMTFTGIPAGHNSIVLRLLNMSGNLSTRDIYAGCAENRGTYSVLKLDAQYNLDAYLNYTKYDAELNNSLANINVSLDNIQPLNAEALESLSNFSDNGLNTINFTSFFVQIDKGLVPLNLSEFAIELRNVSNDTNVNASANHLEQINREQVVPLQIQLDELKKLMQYLQNEANITKADVNAIKTDIANIESSLNQSASLSIKKAVEDFTGNIASRLKGYIDWAKDMVVNKLAPCKPLSNVIDSFELIVCKYLVNSLNSFWFGLGWATILLLPSVIFSVKLAKFYRRMDTEDSYSEPLTPSPKKLPRAQNGYKGDKFA